MTKWSIAGAWILVAALATTLTWQIVSAADAQVSDRPALQIAAPIVGSSPTSATLANSSTSLTAPSTTAATAPSSTTSNSPARSTTPPTEAAWASQTIQTGGGVVVVRYRDGEVVLGSASPAAGFAAEVKKAGPPEVDVEFESESAEYRVRAEWSGGELSVETESDLD